MPIRPIDLQILIPKVTETAKVQQVSKDNIDAQQNILMTQFNEQLQVKREKVNRKDNSDKIRFNKKKHRQDNTKQYKKKKKRHIDLKV